MAGFDDDLRATVADLVSAVFLAAMQSAKRYDPAKAEAISWLFGIAANLLAIPLRDVE